MTYDPEWKQPDEDDYQDFQEEADLPPSVRSRRAGPTVDLTSLSVRVVLTALLVGLAALFFFLLILRPRGAGLPEPTPTTLAAQGATVVLPTFTPGPTATPPPTATVEAAAAEETPEEAAAGELSIGGTAEVANTGNLGVNLRSGPGLNFETIQILAEGTSVRVLDGPREADNYRWWQLEAEDGTTGWAVADYLMPVSQ